jgi:hypothetical protein
MNARIVPAALVLAAALLAAAAPATAGPIRLDAWRGHLSVGYARVFADSLAPGGSISVGGGVDHPVGRRFRLGPAIGYHLLGSSTVERGSLAATVDYSLLEGALLFSWIPASGPLARLSAGPAVGSAHADLSTAGGGLGFTDLAIGEVRGGLALEATVLPRHLTVVAPGLEVGLRWFPVTGQSWTLVTARATVHF